MNVSGMLDQTCDIISISQSRTATGGVTDAESTLYSSIPCSYKLLNGNEAIKYGAENKERLVRFYFKGDQTVLNTHKILFNAEYFNVLDVYNVAGKADLLHVDARLDVTPVITAVYDT
jgi:head-tail adaptor